MYTHNDLWKNIFCWAYCVICRHTQTILIDRNLVNCEWSGWSNTTTCSKTCGGGKQFQTRTIVTHEENGGAFCIGESMQEIDCNSEKCPAGNIFSALFLSQKNELFFMNNLQHLSWFLRYFLYICIQLTAYGVTGAWPLHVVKVAEEENNCKPELLLSMSKMGELCVPEKIYKKLTVIQMVVLLVIPFYINCMR